MTFLLIISCNNADKKEGLLNSINDNKIVKDTTKIGFTTYTRKWLEYDYTDDHLLKRFEVYISDQNDTLSFQKKIFKNNVLDSARSTFYDLQTEFIKNDIVRGKLKLNLESDHRIKSPLISKEIKLTFFQKFNDKNDVIVFESKNKDYVEFEFKHKSDTLTGLIIDRSQFDTIVNGESMVRIIESMMPVDNKTQTDNIFIEAFELNKNER